MGIYDREYYRDEEPGGFRIGGQRMMVTNIVIISVVIWAIDALIPDARVNRILALHSDDLLNPWMLWRLLTYGFVHDPLGGSTGIFHIGLNMFMLWMFGRDIEWKYGWREFLRFYLVSIVFAGAVWLLIRYLTATPGAVVGASGAVTAVVILFVLNYPQRPLYLFMLIAVPAWVAGVLFVGLDILRALGQSDGNIAFEAHLAGALFAFVYHRLGWNLGRLIPFRRMPKSPSFNFLKRKPKLRVHDPESYYEELDKEADRLLDKVHREGGDSLTDRERQILEDYSRRMRQKHR